MQCVQVLFWIVGIRSIDKTLESVIFFHRKSMCSIPYAHTEVKRLKLPPGSMQKEFANEIDALIALDHPAIVRLIECACCLSHVLLQMNNSNMT